MDGVILKQIKVLDAQVYYDFEVLGNLKRFFRTDKLFIEYQESMENVPESILAIPFVASIIPLMWLTNTVMWVKELDHSFYDAVFKIQAAYQRLYYHYPLRGNLVVARYAENKLAVKRQALQLFSGGLDANSTYVRIKDKNPILFNIQGWYERRTDTDEAAKADIRDISRFAKDEGRDFSYVKSNFAKLINSKVFSKEIEPVFHTSWWMGFSHSMSFISIAIPFAYKFGIPEIYIASSIPMGKYRMCASHVTTDGEFRFAGLGKCIHDGSELTRQDKVRLVVEYQRQLARPYFMRVCSFNDHNCCECEKCFRTILGLIAEGADIEDFGFHINGSLKQHWIDVLHRKAGLMSFASEKRLHWPYIMQRMKENYEAIKDKEFVDWFLTFDFDRAKRQGVWRHYRKNFFSILRRKLGL